jgi:hypothetical protein
MRFMGLFHPKAASKILLSGVFPTNQPSQLIAASYLLRIRRICLHPEGCASTHGGTFKVLLQLAIRHTHQRG